MSKIIVRDNGTGMKYEKGAELFRSLGGSWKRTRALSVVSFKVDFQIEVKPTA